MADPTIQTFCCQHPEASPMAQQIMSEFNTDTYNIICMASATLGVCGAIYQILPRERKNQAHRWPSSTALRGRRIIVWLATADLFASLGVLFRASLWLHFKAQYMPATNVAATIYFCALTSAWTQYFYMATWIWTLCYAIDMRLVLKERDGYPKYYHIAAWLLPAFLTAFGLLLLYYPDAKCHSYESLRVALTRILPNYLATYLPMLSVMIVNPILYLMSTHDMENVVHLPLGQITNKERDVMKNIKLKFGLINAAFFICWLPNLVSGVLLWTLWWHLPIRFIIICWYIMAVTNPLQALFNSFVYRRWNQSAERIRIPWRHMQDNVMVDQDTFSYTSRVSSAREEVPLLHSYPRNSINNYSCVQN